jgi:hypothetical protein
MAEILNYVARHREYQHRYYLQRREQKIAYQREYWKIHGDAINSRRRVSEQDKKRKSRGFVGLDRTDYNRRYYLEIRAEALFLLRLKVLRLIAQGKPRCVKCGESDVRILTINHINGGGRKENRNNPIFGWWLSILRGERLTDDLDLRCHNCNILYEYERGTRRLPSNWRELAEMD